MLNNIKEALLLATYYRGNTFEQANWTACTDQVLVLSRFFTGDITSSECTACFQNPGYVGGIYGDDGELLSEIEARWDVFIQLVRENPQLIEGSTNLESALPTYSGCRITDKGISLIPEIIKHFPRKPDLKEWPDRRSYPNPELFG